MHEAGMTDGSRLALIAAFYLSKFDADAISHLGYTTSKEAFNDIGKRFDVKPGSVKNKRDDFDPMFSNARAGWHQRKLGPSRLKVLKLFNEMSFEALTGFVRDILINTEYRESTEVKEILDLLKKDKRDVGQQYVLRGQTGRMAEELFLKWFDQGRIPLEGTIEDKRDSGCGYDFLIANQQANHLVEVKGISDSSGGILFTDKEWQTAKLHTNYWIALFSNLKGVPELQLISNPAGLLRPKRSVSLVVTVTWQLSASQLLINNYTDKEL